MKGFIMREGNPKYKYSEDLNLADLWNYVDDTYESTLF